MNSLVADYKTSSLDILIKSENFENTDLFTIDTEDLNIQHLQDILEKLRNINIQNNQPNKNQVVLYQGFSLLINNATQLKIKGHEVLVKPLTETIKSHLEHRSILVKSLTNLLKSINIQQNQEAEILQSLEWLASNNYLSDAQEILEILVIKFDNIRLPAFLIWGKYSKIPEHLNERFESCIENTEENIEEILTLIIKENVKSEKRTKFLLTHFKSIKDERIVKLIASGIKQNKTLYEKAKSKFGSLLKRIGVSKHSIKILQHIEAQNPLPLEDKAEILKFILQNNENISDLIFDQLYQISGFSDLMSKKSKEFGNDPQILKWIKSRGKSTSNFDFEEIDDNTINQMNPDEKNVMLAQICEQINAMSDIKTKILSTLLNILESTLESKISSQIFSQIMSILPKISHNTDTIQQVYSKLLK